MRSKVVDAAEAVAIIRSGDTVASSGFVGVGTPDEIIKALERRFVATGEPPGQVDDERHVQLDEAIAQRATPRVTLVEGVQLGQ